MRRLGPAAGSAVLGRATGSGREVMLNLGISNRQPAPARCGSQAGSDADIRGIAAVRFMREPRDGLLMGCKSSTGLSLGTAGAVQRVNPSDRPNRAAAILTALHNSAVRSLLSVLNGMVMAGPRSPFLAKTSQVGPYGAGVEHCH